MRSPESKLKPIRSKVMFQGNFKEELQKVLDVIENAIEKDLPDRFVVDSILGGSNNLKVRIDDQEEGVERIVNCIFRHHHNDERYGNIHIDLAISGLGVRPRFHTVGKFSLLDQEMMKEKVLKDFVDCVRRTYQ